jgi:putative glycosyl hydrolase-like family 6 (GHL6) protein/glycosyl hydrolase family 42 (putative beta-galactosidase)
VSVLSRRGFLIGSAFAGTTAVVSGFSRTGGRQTQTRAPARAQEADRTAADWFDRPMRWAQLTLVENDPDRYDPQFWLDYFTRIHADAACLSAGGVVAYYPTTIPLHHRSVWMGDRDPFGQLLRGCRERNMVVIARTDPHAAHQDVCDAHPDWIAVDANGEKRKHWASPELWVTCALGPYNFEFMTAVHKEIASRYAVDGIFGNRWSGSGMCYCEHCQRNFRAAAGLDLPRTSDDAQGRARRAYLAWQEQRLFELWRLWDREIRAINPHARFIANAGGGALSPLDMKTVGETADILFADRQARRGLMPIWTNGKTAKEYRAVLGRKPVGGIFSVGVEEPYRWKDSVQGEAEIRMWVAEGTANGMRPWFTKFSGDLHDRRWLATVENIYRWHHRAEAYLRNERPLARVGLVYSQQTAAWYGGDRARERVEDHALGFYQALIEARVPFEMVHDRLLDRERLEPFKLLILPNIACLSNEQCDRLHAFVGDGGGLVATFETSLYDESGARRREFGLGDLFGARPTGDVEGPMHNSYLRLQPASNGRRHPLLAGLDEAPRIINGVRRVPVEPTKPLADTPLTLIPSYPDLPMEMVYPRGERPDLPQLFLREFGRGRVAFFPWDIDRTFWEVLAADHGRLLANAVDWATNEDRPVIVTGPGLLDVTVWRQRRSMTVHLVNLTNPMMMKGPVRETVPIGAQRVRIRIPGGETIARAHLLVAGTPPAVKISSGYVDVTVPSIDAHEVVALDFR